MQIKTFPHEFLARWGRDGQLQGYHVIPVDIACDDSGVPIKKENGENLLESFGVATTLEKAGLDLSDILGVGLQAALVARDRYLEERNQARAERDDALRAQEAAEGAKAQAEAAQASSEAQVEGLNAQISGLQSRVAELEALLAQAAKAQETP